VRRRRSPSSPPPPGSGALPSTPVARYAPLNRAPLQIQATHASTDPARSSPLQIPAAPPDPGGSTAPPGLAGTWLTRLAVPSGLARHEMGPWAPAWAVAAVRGQAWPDTVDHSAGPGPARS
jgi:hypothetical protein